MRSTGDIQFFVCRSRIIPEPLFPSQGIAGLGNEIVTLETKWQFGKQAFRSVKLVMCLLPRFDHNQLGEDIIKSEEPVSVARRSV